MKRDKPIVIWLISGCILIFLMVVIGGITRLTHSGLSISNYKIITGILPPLDQSEWESAFNLYKQYPEYQKLNSHFTLEDFKSIYFWEWLHRLVGRIVGVVFMIPFLYFIIRKRLSTAVIIKCLVIGFLGGFQGFLGWYMVKSGLIERPDVSHYRLAAHLITAFATCCYTFWVSLGLLFPHKEVGNISRRIIGVVFIVAFLQVLWGAFVAGLDAGFIHNYWPMMSEGKFIHETVYIEKSPLVRNFFEGRSGVQFIHRLGAFLLLILVSGIFYKSFKGNTIGYQRRGINYMTILMLVQFTLGVLTLLLRVPLALGIAHQVGAFLLLMSTTYTFFFSGKPSSKF